MKVVAFVCIFAVGSLVAAAPTLVPAMPDASMMADQVQQDLHRDKRSHYGQQYISPCAAASAAVPVGYQYVPAMHGYPAPQSFTPHHYGYAPHYRSEEEMNPEQEMLSFSDMDHMMSEHMPMARYGMVPAGHAAMTSYGAPAAAGPAYGVFPNANVGGCNVPLLFSCSPSIVQGRMMHGQPHYSYNTGAGDAYRDVDELHGAHNSDQEHKATYEHQSSQPEGSHATAVHQ